MKRTEIENDYRIKDGRIISPGKFEGEYLYMPHFWEAYLNGEAYESDGEGFLQGVICVEINMDDRREFPELEKREVIRFDSTDNGFIYEIKE